MKIQEAINSNKYVCRKNQKDSAFCHHPAKTGLFKDLVDCDYFTIYEDGFLTFSTTGPDLYAEELLADDYELSSVTEAHIKEAYDRTQKLQQEDDQNESTSNKTTYTTLTKLPQSLTKEILLKIANAVMGYKVEQWHTKTSNNQTLPEYLNMTSDDYFAWVEKSDTLPKKYLTSLLKEYNQSPKLYKDFI